MIFDWLGREISYRKWNHSLIYLDFSLIFTIFYHELVFRVQSIELTASGLVYWQVKGLSIEELAARNDLVLALPDRIQAIPDGSSAALKQTGGWGSSAPRTEIKFDSGDLWIVCSLFQYLGSDVWFFSLLAHGSWIISVF